MESQNIPQSEKTDFGVNRSIFLLGIVSFLTDLSSEMIFSFFSIFLTVILGASAALLGIIEGMSDFAASSLDYLAGFLSDRTGKRKTFAILGYAFSCDTQILFKFDKSLNFKRPCGTLVPCSPIPFRMPS